MKNQKFYFNELPGELQKVLPVQLRQAGDVSAVNEMPGVFRLYLATEDGRQFESGRAGFTQARLRTMAR